MKGDAIQQELVRDIIHNSNDHVRNNYADEGFGGQQDYYQQSDTNGNHRRQQHPPINIYSAEPTPPDYDAATNAGINESERVTMMEEHNLPVGILSASNGRRPEDLIIHNGAATNNPRCRQYTCLKHRPSSDDPPTSKSVGFHQNSSILRHSSHPQKSSQAGSSSSAALQDEVLKTLQLLISRQELDDEYEEIASEWREVAQVIDRLLFWVFLVGTVATTLTLLAIIPLVNKADESDTFDIAKYGLPGLAHDR